MKRLICAAAAAAALCLAGCATTDGSFSTADALAAAEATFTATASVVDQDAQAGLFSADDATRIKAGLTAASQALEAAQSAYAAGNATTEQARLADVATAIAQVNGAILSAVAAAR